MSSRPLGRAGEGPLQSSCFSTGASRTFFTANGGFFYRGHCWRHAPHDGGDGADAKEENLFSDRHWRHPHQGETASSTHGFLCLFQPLPNPPQREGVPPNHLKHSRNGLPPLGGGPGRGFRRVGMGLDVELPPLGEGSGRGLHKQRQLCRSCVSPAQGCGRSTLPWVRI